MFSNFNENWYLGLFWSEELIGSDENCTHGHFYDATVSKMAANKIEKLLMVSDFNENWYLGVFWSEELVVALKSDMGVAWELLCLHPNAIKPSYYYYSYYSTFRTICLALFSGMPWSNFMKPWNGCRCHGNGKNAKKLKKHKNDHSRLLAEQKLMKLDRNNIHI
jgi:hypothetical protein